MLVAELNRTNNRSMPMKEQVEDLHPCTLQCVEDISNFLRQTAGSGHDANDKMIFIWTFEQDGDPVQLHMLKTANGRYALAVADFGQGGTLANKWRKVNKVKYKKVKTIICQTDNMKSIYVGEGAVDELI